MAIIRIPNRPERMKVFWRDPEKKPWLQCLYEFLKLSFKKKEIAFYYFKHLYKRNFQHVEDYLSTNQRARIHRSELIGNDEYISILSNKVNFSIFFENQRIRTPKLLGYNFEDLFYDPLTPAKLHTPDEAKNLFIGILEKNNANSLFVRPISALGGKACFKLSKDNLDVALYEHWGALVQGNYLYTAVIKQHPAINKIHKYAVNTIRLLTLVTDGGKPEVVSALMRFGASKKVVDNLTAGGFFVPVDLESGTLKKFGLRENPINRGELLECHPMSGIRFEGFKIPYFEDAFSLVLQATNYLPKKLIGWDVAIGEDGPILIEGNHDPGLTPSDMAVDGLLNNPSFRKFVSAVSKV